MSAPFKVRRVKAGDRIPVVVGSYFATDGAWNRKYICTAVHKVVEQKETLNMYRGYRFEMIQSVCYTEITMTYIGSFYSRGQYEPAQKRCEHLVRVHEDKDGNQYVMVKGYQDQWRLAPQVHVIVN